ncbi:MAG TPA: adenylate/guanylate cyclase domain-containing protein [Anaerolineaceae bacterium]|nr:adenylate/guanylate cyclase domain-containing protein [Anaerolineaceae bacterium]
MSDITPTSTTTFSVLDQHLYSLTVLSNQLQEILVRLSPAALPGSMHEQVIQLTDGVTKIRQYVSVLDEERRSLRDLASIGQVINSTLELDEVLQVVMDTLIRLTGAERGFLMLRGADGELGLRVARNWEKGTIDASETAISSTVINRVVTTGVAILTTNAQEDPRFGGQQSVIAYNLRSILCVPLRVKSEITGVIYADNRIRSGLFTRSDLDLLAGFANQAAVAIENARLFDSVRRTLAEVTELKDLMDNVFSSIASGVLTANVDERVVLCNRAAETILGQESSVLVGNLLAQTLEPLTEMLSPRLKHVIQTDEPVLGWEVSPTLPDRGHVDLRLSLTPLKDVGRHTQGVAIVLDDLTEKKRLEAQRRLFERMVSPAVIEQLDPESLALGGRRAEITVLFADIRGFTSFSEGVTPEELVKVLNCYLASAAEAVLGEDGTIDKFLGDAVMAWFNAPIPQEDHTLRAIRAALGIRTAIQALHQKFPPRFQLAFGVGVHVGEAVLGLVGTEKRMEYTAIGDSVNTAKRVQENAGPGQILITEPTYARVANLVEARPVEAIQAKGKRAPVPAYELIGLRL